MSSSFLDQPMNVCSSWSDQEERSENKQSKSGTGVKGAMSDMTYGNRISHTSRGSAEEQVDMPRLRTSQTGFVKLCTSLTWSPHGHFILGTLPATESRNLRKPWRTSVSMVGVAAGIRRRNLWNAYWNRHALISGLGCRANSVQLFFNAGHWSGCSCIAGGLRPKALFRSVHCALTTAR